MNGTDRWRWVGAVAAVMALGFFAPAVSLDAATDPPPARASQPSPWRDLIAQGEALGLPTKFLKIIPPAFITVEFEDLHTFAAEYHPEEHRMLLNLALSFNGAGGTLKSLAKMTHREVATLFHEFFHAYMDYMTTPDAAAGSHPELAALRTFAEDQQQCRYQAVMITPIAQRKTATELRFLTEREAWEALNETWGVFVGWAVWTKLELPMEKGSLTASRAWLSRLKKADRAGDLVGYYEPENPEERRMAQKRYLAPSHSITPCEVKQLLKVAFGEPEAGLDRAEAMMNPRRPPLKEASPCAESKPETSS